jgi:putative ubiquitin-RnfH superfamily antitoxin RatB of RatAB toxin-antitoxin module
MGEQEVPGGDGLIAPGEGLVGVARLREQARARAAEQAGAGLSPSHRQALEVMRAGLAQYAEQVRSLAVEPEVVAANVRAGLAMMGEAQRRIATMVPSSPEALARVASILSRVAVRASDALRLVTPTNLVDLSVEEWLRLVDVAVEQRMGVAWVPRVEVLRALLDAPDEVRRTRVVEASADGIVADCAAALRDVDGERFVDLAGFGLRAVAAFEAGHPEAAQALAANVLDSALHLFAEGPRVVLRTVRGWDAVEEQQVLSLRFLRLQLAVAGIPMAYQHYKAGSGDAGFSRNGTAHAVNEALYTRANAARALSLAVTWLRLVQAMHMEGLAWNGEPLPLEDVECLSE